MASQLSGLTPAPESTTTTDLEAAVRAAAACYGQDPNRFFPVWFRRTAKGSREMETAYAQRVCAGCQVSAQCLELALRIPAGEHGVWGGTTDRDRVDLRRKRAEGGAPRAAAA